MQVGAGGASSSTSSHQPSNNTTPVAVAAAVAERVAAAEDDGDDGDVSVPSTQSGSLEEVSTIGVVVDGGRALAVVDGVAEADVRVPHSGGRSVGQRIKEAVLNANHGGYSTAGTGAATNGNSAQTTRHCRTTPLYSTAASLIDGCVQLPHGNSHYPCSGAPHKLRSSTTTSSQPSVQLTDVQRNTIRVIGQYLRDLGMSDTVGLLMEESGCHIEDSLSIRLRGHVTQGEWQKALDIVEKLKPSITHRQYLTVRVLLLEEKFKDFLSRGEFLHALHLLQTDYPAEREFRARREHLATLLMSGDSGAGGSFIVDYLGRQDKEKNNEQVLKVLHKVLPPSMMLPPARLEELLRQSWQYQTKNCELHLRDGGDQAMEDGAILKDHHCSIEDFPTRCTNVLGEHNSEVWFLEFSPCGRYLASGAKSNEVLVWKVEAEEQRVRIYRRLKIPHELTGVASLSWSQDGRYLAVCATEENATGVFVCNVEKNVCLREYKHFPSDSFSVVAFFKRDGSHRMAAGSQKGHFMAYDIDRQDESPRLIEGFRIRCLYSMKDGKTVLAADTHNRIRQYDFESLSEQSIITETSLIMFFTVDDEERHCLVTTKTEGLRLWCLKTRTLLRSFFGSVHSEFVITSSFGGTHNNFIASGSEDEHVVIWNKERSEPVRRLSGHSGTVNAVSWNPRVAGMLASGSDDGTIRIWTAKRPADK